MSEPVRAVKASEDLDEQFDGIVDALRRDVRTLRQQVERYGRTYQKRAEDRSRQTTHGELDEETQRGYRRLKQLQLVIQHIESSAAYLLGSGIDPSSDSDDEAVEVAQRVLGVTEQPSWSSMPDRSWDTELWVADVSKIERDLGWRPTVDFDEGLARTAAWLRGDAAARDRYAEWASR